MQKNAFLSALFSAEVITEAVRLVKVVAARDVSDDVKKAAVEADLTPLALAVVERYDQSAVAALPVVGPWLALVVDSPAVDQAEAAGVKEGVHLLVGVIFHAAHAFKLPGLAA